MYVIMFVPRPFTVHNAFPCFYGRNKVIFYYILYIISCDQSRSFFFSLLLELCKAVRLPVLGLRHLFSFPSRIFSSSSFPPTFQTIAILSYFWWLLSTFHIRIKVSTTHICFYNSFSCFHTYVSSSYSFQHRT